MLPLDSPLDMHNVNASSSNPVIVEHCHMRFYGMFVACAACSADEAVHLGIAALECG